MKHIGSRSEAGARLVSRERDVRVRFEQDAVPATDGKRIVLPAPAERGDRALALEEHRASLAHEAGHVRHTDMEAYTSLSPFGQHVFNCLEDVRVETLVGQDYRGYGQDLRRSAARHARSLLQLMQAGLDPAEEVLVALLVQHALGRAPALSAEAEKLRALAGPELAQLEDLRRDPERQASRQLAQVARRIVELWGERRVRAGVGGTALSLHEALATGAREAAGSEGEPGAYSACTDTDEVGRCVETDVEVARDDQEAISKHLVPVRRALQRVLQLHPRPRTIGEQERGQRLDARALWKLAALGDTRIFEQEVPGTRPDAAFALLVDESGSMHGDKIAMARRAALLLAAGLEEVGVPVLVAGHSTVEPLPLKSADLQRVEDRRSAGFARCDSLRVQVYKDFADGLRGARPRLGCMRARNHNVDGEALAAVAMPLARRREAHRHLLVLSDGSPECSLCAEALLVSHLTTALRAITAAGVGVTGIGIQTDNVERLYPSWLVIEDLAELGPALVRLARGAIARAPGREVRGAIVRRISSSGPRRSRRSCCSPAAVAREARAPGRWSPRSRRPRSRRRLQPRRRQRPSRPASASTHRQRPCRRPRRRATPVRPRPRSGRNASASRRASAPRGACRWPRRLPRARSQPRPAAPTSVRSEPPPRPGCSNRRTPCR
jgi:cobalamin biosynthesis protein CobT